MNDQKIKSDRGKSKLSLVPRRIIFDIAAIREYGNKKYPDGGVDNWKRVEPERYRDAAFRHLLAYLDDPYGMDEESGLPHLWHLACNIAFLCEMEDCEFTNITASETITTATYPDFIRSDNPVFEDWTKAWREHDGEAEFCRKNKLNGKIQFGDYDPIQRKIIPREEKQDDNVGWFNWVTSHTLSDISKEWKEKNEQGRSD